MKTVPLEMAGDDSTGPLVARFHFGAQAPAQPSGMAYRCPSCDPTKTVLVAGSMAGEEVTGPPVEKLKLAAPVVASTPYTLPSSDPKTTRPPETAGDDTTFPPVLRVHRTAPVVASMA